MKKFTKRQSKALPVFDQAIAEKVLKPSHLAAVVKGVGWVGASMLILGTGPIGVGAAIFCVVEGAISHWNAVDPDPEIVAEQEAEEELRMVLSLNIPFKIKTKKGVRVCRPRRGSYSRGFDVKAA